MPDVGDAVRLTLTVDPFDGTTEATATATSPAGTDVLLTAVTEDGGATWAANLELTAAGAWPILWTVTGQGAGVQRDVVYAFAPVTGRTYATRSDLASYLHAEPSQTADRDLVTATRLVDALLIGAVYPVDDDGYPTLAVHIAALRDAVCAQAAWFDETGDSTGNTAAGSVSIGNVSIGAPTSQTRGSSGGAPSRYAPDTVLILRTAGMLPLNALVYG